MFNKNEICYVKFVLWKMLHLILYIFIWYLVYFMHIGILCIVYEKNIPITRHKIPTTVYILFLNLIKLQHLNLINRTMIVIKAKLYTIYTEGL